MRLVGANATTYVENNIVQSTVASSVNYSISGGAHSSSNNISEDDTSPDGASYQDIAIQFMNEGVNNFHLDPIDPYAVDGALDLSSDATLNFTTDIDGQIRPAGLSWDIGADEAPIRIYRSVASGKTTALAGGWTGANLTVSGNIATLSADLSTNIGVGDVIEYDRDNNGTLDAVAFIHGRTNARVFTVASLTGSTPVQCSAADLDWRLYRAYTSLANAESGTENSGCSLFGVGANVDLNAASGGYDLVTNNMQWNIACYANGSDADTSSVTVNGWTTGTSNYLRIYTPHSTSEVGESARHFGKWDSRKYWMDITGNFYIYEPDVRIDGLQIKGNGTNNIISYDNAGSEGGEKVVSNSILRHGARGISSVRANTTIRIYNNIIYDMTTMGIRPSAANVTAYLYNNTLYDTGTYGIYVDAGGSVIAINNIVCGSGNVNTYTGTFASGTDYNATDGSDDIGEGTHNRTLQEFQFVSIMPGSEDFHLSVFDTAARDQGVDLSIDLSFSLVTDIDGNVRPIGGVFDIGADEAMSVIFRSVGPGNTTDLQQGADSGGIDLTISGLTATFSQPLAYNIGVGDVIEYDKDNGGSVDAICFISGRMSSQVFLVRSLTGSTPQQCSTADQDWSIYRAYTSLANAESGTENTGPTIFGDTVADLNAASGGYDLVANNMQWNIACYADGVDTTNVDINGWNTSLNAYVRIFTPAQSDEVGVSQRHTGKWGDGYRRTGYMRIYEGCVRLAGLSFNKTSVGSAVFAYNISGDYGEIDVSHCYIQSNDGTSNSPCFYAEGSSCVIEFKIWNNILVNTANLSSWSAGIVQSDPTSTMHVYNNTIVTRRGNGVLHEHGGLYLQNNLLQVNGAGAGISGSPNRVEYCASSDSTADNWGGAGNKVNQTFAFVDSTNNDYHLSSSDTAARDAGSSSPLTSDLCFLFTDIDGTARGASWDIGADEVPVDFISVLSESGGDYATLASWEDAVESDISAASTRVFSGTLTGTLAEDDAVTVYSTSLALTATGTVVAITADGQILVDNIDSLLPLGVASGDVWSLDASNYFTVAGSGDELGASAVAVCKIDGEWASADTDSVEIDDWTTDHDNYIKIYTTALARHDGMWNTSKYRLVTDAYFATLHIYEANVRIDGLQVENTAVPGGGEECGGIRFEGYPDDLVIDAHISNNIVRRMSAPSIGTEGSGICIDGGIYSGTVRIYNNSVYGYYYGIVAASSYAPSPGFEAVVYNNTVINAHESGIALHWFWLDKQTFTLKNNIALFSGVADYAIEYGVSTALYTASNISSDVSSPDAAFKHTLPKFHDAANFDFHLSSDDTVARDKGADLSSDATINFATDIDSQTRGNGFGWDIGADEAPARIFRSVGPDKTTALGGGWTGASLTISGYTATLSADLSTNIGVGDVFEYDRDNNGTLDSVAFICGRVQSTVYSVQSLTGSIPFQTTAVDLDWKLYRACTSIQNAFEGTANTGTTLFTDSDFSGRGVDLIANNYQWNMACYADAADTTTFTDFSDWSTSGYNYVKLYTPTQSSEVGVSQRHQGKWDTSKFYSSVAGGAGWTLLFGGGEHAGRYTEVEGLQFEKNTGAWLGVIRLSTNFSGGVRISNNIFKGNFPGGDTAIHFQNGPVVPNYVYNNIIYGFHRGVNRSASGDVYVYNNTIVNCVTGINAASNWYVKNNLVFYCTTAFSGTFHASSDYNATDAISATGGSNDRLNQNVAFEDVYNNDYHLAVSDTVARDSGTDLSVELTCAITKDIDGTARGAGWDIGADEVARDFVYTLTESGVDASTLAEWEDAVECDLSAESTRVFSGTLTGTLAENTAVTLYRAGQAVTTSGTLTVSGTVVAVSVTNGQILIDNINTQNSSLTTQNSDQWYASAGNYFEISGSGDDLGASAVAVAKIDGTWTSADSTACDINGWTTDYDNYIKIYTTSEARHLGKWDDTKYRIQYSTAASAEGIDIWESYVFVDGVQIEVTAASGFPLGIRAMSPEPGIITISNNIVAAKMSGTANVIGISGHPNNYATLRVVNNIVYDLTTGIRSYSANSSATYMYNNTAIDCGAGFSRATAPAYALNNIAQGCTDGYNGTFEASSDFNISNIDSDAPNATFSTSALTVSFVNSINNDFRLAEYDTVARDSGTSAPLTDSNLSFYADIQGTARGYAWDIGADEVAVDFISVLSETGGDYATLADWEDAVESDISAATTRVFSGTLTGTLAENDIVLLYRNGQELTLTGGLTVSGTVVATTNAGQILIDNLLPNAYNLIPITAKPGDLWRLDASNYFTVAGSGDALGASAVALCQINGLWSSADVAAVTIDGWTTDVDNYIKIYTTSSARHEGRWHSGRYRMSFTDPGEMILIREACVRIDGLQIEKNIHASGGVDPALRAYAMDSAPSEIHISNTILREIAGSTGNSDSIGIHINDLNAIAKIWNNIVYNFTNTTARGILVENSNRVYIYNNTVYGCDTGYSKGGYPGIAIAWNNIASQCTNGYAGTFEASSDFNISDINGDAPNATFSTAAITINFNNAGNGDFHLSSSDTDAIDAGRDLSIDGNLTFSTDIDGEARPNGDYWDIGADEYSLSTGPLVGAVMIVSELPESMRTAGLIEWAAEAVDNYRRRI
jgi:hypothetical protein